MKIKSILNSLVIVFVLIVIGCLTSHINDCKEEEGFNPKLFHEEGKHRLANEFISHKQTIGVAVNIITEKPRNPGNLVALLHNIRSNIPENWPIQIFSTSRSMSEMARIPGIHKLTNTNRLLLQQVPSTHDHLTKRELLLSKWLWSTCLQEHVFIFDGTSALCGNSPYTIEDFLSYDWIGAAWKWAKPGSPHEWGGNGALSLRNRKLMLQILTLNIPNETNDILNENLNSISTSSLFAKFKGNEDMWYVRKLFELKDHLNIKLAPKNESMKWAIEELYDETKPISFGVYHTMRSMTNQLRTKVLNQCPEAKRLFEVNHELIK